MTLAGGYRNFFVVADANYSQTDIGFDERFKAFIATIRAGYRSVVNDHPVQLWVGQGYWNTTNIAKGHTDVEGIGRIESEADKGPTYPWMTDSGLIWDIASNSRRSRTSALTGMVDIL